MRRQDKTPRTPDEEREGLIVVEHGRKGPVGIHWCEPDCILKVKSARSKQDFKCSIVRGGKLNRAMTDVPNNQIEMPSMGRIIHDADSRMPQVVGQTKFQRMPVDKGICIRRYAILIKRHGAEFLVSAVGVSTGVRRSQPSRRLRPG